MRKLLLVFSFLVGIICYKAQAQGGAMPNGLNPRMDTYVTYGPYGPTYTNYFYAADDEMAKKSLSLYDFGYIINGLKVSGTPFLFQDWFNGSITTDDGRIYSAYRLRYNAYHQTVFFLNGTDSLEVNEPIKEFVLAVKYADSLVMMRFVNGAQYKKERKPVFYELLVDGDKGQLLKLNKKIVTDAANGLPIPDGRHFFGFETSYFYYNKTTKKLIPLKQDAANVATVLDITSEAEKNSIASQYDYAKEADLKKIFTQYTSAKAF